MENELLEEALEALDRLHSFKPTHWNGVGWDGDLSNQFGWECVEEEIYKTLTQLGYWEKD